MSQNADATQPQGIKTMNEATYSVEDGTPSTMTEILAANQDSPLTAEDIARIALLEPGESTFVDFARIVRVS